MSLCKDCVSGFTHEGEPKGKFETIAGVNTYVATPPGDYPKDKIILFLSDVFGPQLPNAQLLADDFAHHGIKTVIPDYLDGDPIPPDALDEPGKFDIMEWLKKHGSVQVRKSLDKVIQALKDEGVVSFGATGYCFGGRYVFDLAFENVLKVSVVNHPSLLKSPEDLETYFAKSKAPLLINSCTVDSQFPHEAQTKADEILGNGKFTPGYKREYFEGCEHGFAVRGNMKDPKVKKGKEGAFTAATEWFHKYL